MPRSVGKSGKPLVGAAVLAVAMLGATPALAADIADARAVPQATVAPAVPLPSSAAVGYFYQTRNNALIWFRAAGPSAAASQLVAVLQRAPMDGLANGPQLAAQAGRAAAAQDRFWEFQSAVYGLELPPHSGELTAERLTQIAGDLGLDTDAFARDLASAATVEAVARDFAEGQGLGISGTPAFLVNGVPIMGAQPTEVFEETIEAALDAAGAGQGG